MVSRGPLDCFQAPPYVPWGSSREKVKWTKAAWTEHGLHVTYIGTYCFRSHQVGWPIRRLSSIWNINSTVVLNIIDFFSLVCLFFFLFNACLQYLARLHFHEPDEAFTGCSWKTTCRDCGYFWHICFFYMHFLMTFVLPDYWYHLCHSRLTAAFVMRLCSWRFLVCRVTAWCLLALARWTATTMMSGASVTQQPMASNGQLEVLFVSFFFRFALPTAKISCILLQVNISSPSHASLSAGPWRQVCSAPCWSALHTRTILTAPRWLL